MLEYLDYLPSDFVKVTLGKPGNIYQHVADAVFTGADSLCQDLFSHNIHRVDESPVACYKMLQIATGIMNPELSFVLLDAADYWTFSKAFGSQT